MSLRGDVMDAFDELNSLSTKDDPITVIFQPSVIPSTTQKSTKKGKKAAPKVVGEEIVEKPVKVLSQEEIIKATMVQNYISTIFYFLSNSLG